MRDRLEIVTLFSYLHALGGDAGLCHQGHGLGSGAVEALLSGHNVYGLGLLGLDGKLLRQSMPFLRPDISTCKSS